MPRTGVTENMVQFHEGNSMHAYGEIPKKTQQDLLDEKEYADYKLNCETNPRGMPGHLLSGHGPSPSDTTQFEKRDMLTTSKMFMEERRKIKDIIAPCDWRQENMTTQKVNVNNKTDSIPAFLRADPGVLKPRGYSEFTKKYDANYMKLGLRK